MLLSRSSEERAGLVRMNSARTGSARACSIVNRAPLDDDERPDTGLGGGDGAVDDPLEGDEFLVVVAGREIELGESRLVQGEDALARRPRRGGPVAVGDAARRQPATGGALDRRVEILAQEKALAAREDHQPQAGEVAGRLVDVVEDALDRNASLPLRLPLEARP